MSHWGATVITNLLSAIPFVGNDIVPFLFFFLPFSFNLFILFFNYLSYNYNLNINSNHNNLINIYENSHIKSILSLLIGLIDANGDIRISKNNKLDKDYINLTIILNLKYSNEDKYMLEYIKDILNIGIIYNITPKKGNKIIRYEISKLDIINKLFPLLTKYKIQLLTESKQNEFFLFKYILDNNIIYYNDYLIKKDEIQNYIQKNIIKNNFNKLSFFNNWLIGFTIGNGRFLIKNNGDACYQLKLINNYNLLLNILNYFNFYNVNILTHNKIYHQLTVSSIINISIIINFFNSKDNHSLIGSKLTSYNNWLLKLKSSNRYKYIFIFKYK